MNQPDAKPRSKPIQKIPSTPRSDRSRWRLALLLAGIALVLSAYRVHNVLSRPRVPVLLRLGDNVELTSPPPLPADDRLALQAGLQSIAALHAEAQLHPNDPPLYLGLAHEAIHVGDMLTAYEAFRAALRLNPQAEPSISNAFGQCELQLGLYAESLHTYQDLIARAPTRADGYTGAGRAYYYLGRIQESYQALERGTHAIPASDVLNQLHIAYEYEQKGALERALAVAQTVRAAAPDDPVALKLTGHLLFKLARLSEARSLLEKLVAAHPEDTAARVELAAIVDNPMQPHRDRALAEHLLLQVLQRDPNLAPAYSQLGTIYQEQGRYRQAAYVSLRLLQITPDSAASRLQLSKAYAGLGDTRSSQEQQAIAQRLLARDLQESHLTNQMDHRPGDPQIRLALARHYTQSGQYANALAQLQAAYCLTSGSAQVRQYLAALYQQIGVSLPALPDLRAPDKTRLRALQYPSGKPSANRPADGIPLSS